MNELTVEDKEDIAAFDERFAEPTITYEALLNELAATGKTKTNFIHHNAKRNFAMKNQVVWVDIPVTDLDRAIDFYAAVLGERVDRVDNGGVTIGLLPHAEDQTSGCLYVSEDYPPTADGPLIYLNVEGRMDEAVLAADRHGGKVIEPQHQIGEHGFRTIVIDPEGNRIALHAKTA